MSDYWGKRQLKTQNKIANKTIKETEEQLAKYYEKAFKKVISDFEATYDKVLAAIGDDRQPTPADLYKLDRYWQMQNQLKKEAEKLGNKEIALLSKNFEEEWKEIYTSIALPSDSAFSTMSLDNAKQMINQVWLADGKNFSERIWDNTSKLVETLNDELINCVVTGKSTDELRSKLIERFDVSRRQANTLIRTEVTHIQTQAAAQRYQDYGLTKYKFLADTDEKTCDKCGALDGKIFYYSEMQAGKNAPPMHPNDRCTIIPVIDTEVKEEDKPYAEYLTKKGYTKKGIQKEIDSPRGFVPWNELTREDYKFFHDNNAAPYKRNKADTLYGAYNEYLKKHEHLADELAKLSDNDKMARFVVCIDCGEVFMVANKNNAAKRCPDCQAKYRKKYKAEKEKQRRKKKKTK